MPKCRIGEPIEHRGVHGALAADLEGTLGRGLLRLILRPVTSGDKGVSDSDRARSPKFTAGLLDRIGQHLLMGATHTAFDLFLRGVS